MSDAAAVQHCPGDSGDEEVANDAMQLLAIANFNGLCRVITALAENGGIDPDQLEGVEDAMTAPLDDPDWRDYGPVASTRDILHEVLAAAMKESKRWHKPEE